MEITNTVTQTDNTMTKEYQKTSDIVDAGIAKHGSFTNWIQWRKENEPGFTETIVYNSIYKPKDK
jgi:hypothetical protein